MSALSKFGQFKPDVIPVSIAEWGGETLYVKGMDAAGMEAFFDINAEGGEGYSAERSARIVVLHLCDADGNRLIPAEERDEAVAELCGHKFSVLSELLTASMKASGLAQDEIEDAAKN